MRLEPWAYWLLFLVIAVTLLVDGFRFRRERRRALLAYRNPALPTFARRGSIASAPVGALSLPLLVLTAPLIVDPRWITDLPRNITVAIMLAGFGWFLFVGGLFFVLTYRPPARLIPPWLKEADERDGYVAPPPDWFDRLLFVFGILAVIGSVGLLVGAAIAAAAPGVFGW